LPFIAPRARHTLRLTLLLVRAKKHITFNSHTLFEEKVLVRMISGNITICPALGVGGSTGREWWCFQKLFSPPFQFEIAHMICFSHLCWALVVSQALRLVDLSGLDISSALGRRGLNGLWHTLLLFFRWSATKLAHVSWHWLLVACFCSAMVCDAFAYLGGSQQKLLEARSKDLPMGTQMEERIGDWVFANSGKIS
jgi:CDP-diglyceride synthetase